MLKVLSKLLAIKEYLNRAVIGREPLIDMILHALVTQNHVFVYGPPGVAKTYTAKKAFKFLAGEIFTVQCSKRMSEDYMIGPPDMKLFKEEGIIEHRVEGYLPTAQFAIIDEALDAPDSVLRAMLGILNERQLLNGRQNIDCPMHTTLFATNYSPESEALEAVEDRFLFRLHVGCLSSSDQLMSMLSCDDVDCPDIRISVEELKFAAVQIGEIFLPEMFKRAVVDIALACRKEGLTVSDRRIKWAFDAIKAKAFFANRPYAMPADLDALANVFIISGRGVEEQKFASIMSKMYSGMAGADVDNLYRFMYLMEVHTEEMFLNSVVGGTPKVFERNKKSTIEQLDKLIEVLLSEQVPTHHEREVQDYLEQMKKTRTNIKQLRFEECV